MDNLLDGLSTSENWKLLVGAAKKGAMSAGYALKRLPGRGLSNTWLATKDGQTYKAAIRTTRDRWVAFPPLEGGTKWKTLDDVQLVIVAALDSKDRPQAVDVYVFPADEVRKRFTAAYKARVEDGQVQKDNFGFWVGLDKDKRNIAASVGSGIAEVHPPVATYPITALLKGDMPEVSEEESLESDVQAGEEPAAETIADVIAWARARIARIAGVAVDAVRLELKVSY